MCSVKALCDHYMYKYRWVFRPLGINSTDDCPSKTASTPYIGEQLHGDVHVEMINMLRRKASSPPALPQAREKCSARGGHWNFGRQGLLYESRHICMS